MGIDGTQSIADGLVIQDAEENEFVWIPVTYEATGKKDANGLYPGFLSTFVRSNVNDEYYSEPYEGGYSDGEGTEEIADYYNMMRSVQKNKGFYVGRYEAGAQKEDSEGNIIARTEVANGTSKVVVKRDQYPYIFVGWGSTKRNYIDDVMHEYFDPVTENDVSFNQGKGAVYLSKHLLDGKETGATSTLMYGVQWDAMLRFMGKLEETDSTEWGNYYNNKTTIDRETAKYTTSPKNDPTWTTIGNSPKEKSNEEWIFLTTGASDEFEIKNIYDVAGNVNEWTMEMNGTSSRVYRGPNYAADRYENPTDICTDCEGFRPALYITNK